MKKVLFFLQLFFALAFCFAQQEQSSNLVIRPELMLGKSIPSYELFTGKNPQLVLGLSYEHKNNDKSVAWQSILNYPKTGIGLFYTNYGSKIKGESLSLIPFIEFHPFKNYHWSTKFGMGISYFNTKYNPITNPENNAISSDFTWAIQGFLYYDAKLKSDFDLRLGLGVFHHSNGHIRLPNEGLNAAMLSVSTTLDLKSKISHQNKVVFDKTKIKKYSDYFYEFKIGNGIQSFVNENSAVKSVYTLEAKGGTYFKNVVKLSFGINYRYYQHYYDYIKNNNLAPFNSNITWNASNINVTVGAEVLLGKIGIDWEGGLNLYKSFYKTHFDLQKTKSKYKLKKLFLGRLGLKLYVINTKNNPKNNLCLAAHINSNLSQADFSELSIGFVHHIFKNKK